MLFPCSNQNRNCAHIQRRFKSLHKTKQKKRRRRTLAKRDRGRLRSGGRNGRAVA
jgi:hypothetical protein